MRDPLCRSRPASYEAAARKDRALVSTKRGMRVEHRDRRRAAEIAAWRRRQLVDSGFPPALARRLAREESYDLHGLIELVERGCPPALAVRILAPLEERIGV
jgi:hypothetical protein